MSKIDRLVWANGAAVNTYGHRIGIRTNDDAGLPLALSMFPPGWTQSKRTRVNCLYSFVLGGVTAGRRRFHLLYRDAQRLARSHDLDEVLEVLRQDLELHVANASPSKVFLHAGVVGWHGRALVLPGRTFAGKSTLVDALVQAGGSYYSDEFAVIDAVGRVHPFARAVRLRTRPDEQEPRASGIVGPFHRQRPLEVAMVVATQFVANGQWSAERLSPGDGLLAILEHAVPLRARPARTIDSLAKIARTAPIYRGTRGEVQQATEELINLLTITETPCRNNG